MILGIPTLISLLVMEVPNKHALDCFVIKFLYVFIANFDIRYTTENYQVRNMEFFPRVSFFGDKVFYGYGRGSIVQISSNCYELSPEGF